MGIEGKAKDTKVDQKESDTARRHIVVLLHGIRTFAEWQDNVDPELRSAGFVPKALGYQRFGLFGFLLPIPIARMRIYRDIERQIRSIKENNPSHDVSIIAHSFGTYVLGYLLKETDITFYKIMLCGSILPENFNFISHRAKFGRRRRSQQRSSEVHIVNHCGEKDIWPAIAWFLTWWYGKSGRYGFRQDVVLDRFHSDLGHRFFDRDFVKQEVIPFLSDNIRYGMEPRITPSFIHRLFSVIRLNHLVMILLLLIGVFNWRCVYVMLGGADSLLREYEREWATNIESLQTRERGYWEDGVFSELRIAFDRSGENFEVIKPDVTMYWSEHIKDRNEDDVIRTIEKLNRFYQQLGLDVLNCRMCNAAYYCGKWGTSAERFSFLYGHLFDQKNEYGLVRNESWPYYWRGWIEKVSFGMVSSLPETFASRLTAFTSLCKTRYGDTIPGPSSRP